MTTSPLTARSLMTRFVVGERARISGAVAAGVMTILSSVCLLAVSAYLIERASQRPPILSLEVAIVSVRFFGISRGIFRYLDRYLSHDASFRLLGDIRADIYRRLIPLAPAGLERFGRGDVFARVAADVDTMQEWFVRGFAPLAISLLTAVILVVAGAVILPAAGLALMLALTGAALATLLISGSGRGSEVRELELRGDFTADAVEYIHGIADLTAMGAALGMAGRLEDLEQGRSRLAAARSARDALAAAIQSALPGLVAALLGAVAIAALAGGLNPLQVGVLVFGGMGAVECVTSVSPAIAAWKRGHAAAARLAELTSQPDFVAPAGTRELTSPARGITISNLSYRYEPSSPYVLWDLSLDLAVGGQAMIVGPSGAGKSTLASLLLRFRSPSGGYVAVNGVDISTLNEECVRRTIGAAGQHAHLFTGSILENVKLARPEASDLDIRTALERARLDAWVDELPNGWDTQVGEHGNAVSGGQQRRIALARAFLAAFPILIADEPTEGLDELTARDVMQTLFSQSSANALLVITHRPDLCPPSVPAYELVGGSLQRRPSLVTA